MSKDADSEDERLFDETISNHSDKELIFKTYISDMIRYLRNYDKKKGTRLARLFVTLINPRHGGAVIQIQKKLGISNKTFNDDKALISSLLSMEFGDISHEIISFFEQRRHLFSDHAAENKASRKFDNKKKQEQEDQKSRPYRMNVIYGQKPCAKDKSKSVYYVTIQIDRSKTKSIVAYSTDGWEKVYKKEETMTGKPGELDKMKLKLQKLVKIDIKEATDLFLKFKEETKSAH
jgi:hypothetical protein